MRLPMQNRIFIRTTVITLAVVTAYIAAWFIFAEILKSNVTQWIEARRADGYTISYDNVVLVGFPRRWKAVISSPKLEVGLSRKNRAKWTGNKLKISWAPWNSNMVGFRAEDRNNFTLLNSDGDPLLAMDLDRVTGYYENKRLSVQVNNVSILSNREHQLHMTRFRLDAALWPHGRDLKIPNYRQLWLNAKTSVLGLTLPEQIKIPLGQTINNISMSGSVMGPIPGGPTKAALSGWSQAGGTLKFDNVILTWAKLMLTAGGTAALDAKLQPIAAFTAQISGYRETIDAIVDAGLIKPSEALITKLTLRALAKISTEGNHTHISVPITVQKGWLNAGPLKLFKIPPIKWK